MDLSEQSERMQSFYDLTYDPFGAIVDSMVFSGAGSRYELAETIRHLLTYSQQDSLLEGPVGIGKRMLAQQVIKMLDESWRVAWVDAAELDTPKAFEKEIIGQLGLGLKAEDDTATLLKKINAVVAQRYDDEESFLLVVQRADHANEFVMPLLRGLREQAHDSDHRIRQLWLAEDGQVIGEDDENDWYRHALEPLDDDEAGQYIRDRMIAAGYVDDVPIPESDIARLNQLSDGLPLQLNETVRDYLISSTFKTTEKKQSFPLTHAIAGLAALSLVTIAFLYQASDSRDTPGSVDTEEPDRPLSSVEQRLADAVAQVEARQQQSEVPDDAGSEPSETPVTADPPEPTEISEPESVPTPDEPVTVEESHERVQVAVDSSSDRSESDLPSLIERGGDQQFTVQLIGVRDRTQLNELLTVFDTPQNADILATTYQDAPWFILIYGQFETRAQAQQAFDALPEGVFTGEPWIRTFQSLRASLNN